MGDKTPWGEERKCRDVFMLIIFVLLWGFNFYITSHAVEKGDPYRLIYGYDFYGRTCGKNKCYDHIPQCACNTSKTCDMTDRPVLFYPNPLKLQFAICLPACPSELEVIDMNDLNSSNLSPNIKKEDLISPFVIPDDLSSYIPMSVVPEEYRHYASAASDKLNLASLVVTYPTTKLPKVTRCAPALDKVYHIIKDVLPPTSISVGNFTLALSADALHWEEHLNRMDEHKWILLASAGVALLFGFGYLLLIRLCVGAVTWITIILAQFFLIMIAFISLWKSGQIDTGKFPGNTGAEVDAIMKNITYANPVSGDAQDYLKWTGIIFSVLSLICFVLVIFMCSRINFAIKVMKQAARVMADMPLLIFIPLLPVIFTVAFAMYGFVVSLFLGSVGKWEEAKYKYTLPDIDKYYLWGHWFMCLWMLCLIQAGFEYTVGAAVCQWYFERKKKTLQFPILNAIKDLLRYYLGSVAFGSLIVTIMKVIRIVFNYLASKMESAKENKSVQFAIACINCCLACIERFIRFLNENAYIQIALHGKSFCPAAKDAFLLLLNNAARVAALQFVSKVFVFLGKIMIAMCATLFGMIWLSDWKIDKLNSMESFDPFTTLVIMVVSYMAATAFLAIFDMTVDTIFQCIIEDLEKHPDAAELCADEEMQTLFANKSDDA